VLRCCRCVATFGSPLHRGTWMSRYLQSVASNIAQSCTSAHSRLASLNHGAPRVPQLAAALRPLAVTLRAERRAWFSSKLHSGIAASRQSTSERRV